MKIIVLGNGFIASHLKYEKVAGSLFRGNYDKKYADLLVHKPDIVINCAGWGGINNIDDCENDKFRTYNSNTSFAVEFALICEELDIRFINISSGCIYSGQSPHSSYHIETEHYENGPHNKISYPKISDWKDTGWRESDPALPVSYYSKTKYASDLIMEDLKNTTLLRIRMPISSKPHPRNLISKLIAYKKVIDIPNSITSCFELSSLIDWVIEKEKFGVYNATNPEPIKHSDLLNEYQKYFPEHKYEKISEYELSKIVKTGRSNCILDNSKLISQGFKFQSIKDIISQTMKEFVSNIKD